MTPKSTRYVLNAQTGQQYGPIHTPINIMRCHPYCLWSGRLSKHWVEIKTGSEKSEVGMHSTQFPLKSPWDIDEIALPRASTRCQPSIETWMRLLLCCGTEWQQNDSGVWQSAISWSRAFHLIATWVPWLLKTQRNTLVGTLLKINDKNILIIDSVLSLKCFVDL